MKDDENKSIKKISGELGLFGGDIIAGLDAGEVSQMLGMIAPQNLIQKTKDIMWSMVRYKELRMMYTCALKEIQTKFEVLNTEFKSRYERNPINKIATRLKSTDSITDKLERYGEKVSLDNIVKYVNDFAGIRVVCSYIDDIYKIADALLKQDDITLIKSKDYIKTPKENGYRSLHLIVSVPVFFAEKKEDMKVEVQIRTIAMDFWASLEHQMKYKQDIPDEKQIIKELTACAEIIAATDEHMLALRKRIEAAEDIPTEDEQLFERLMKLDAPI